MCVCVVRVNERNVSVHMRGDASEDSALRLSLSLSLYVDATVLKARNHRRLPPPPFCLPSSSSPRSPSPFLHLTLFLFVVLCLFVNRVSLLSLLLCDDDGDGCDLYFFFKKRAERGSVLLTPFRPKEREKNKLFIMSSLSLSLHLMQ